MEKFLMRSPVRHFPRPRQNNPIRGSQLDKGEHSAPLISNAD
jgi:hypothetical protein